MVTIAIALTIRIVFVNEKLSLSPHLLDPLKRGSDNPLPGFLVGHNFPGGDALRTGVFGVGAVDIQPASVRQHLVQQSIVVRAGSLPLSFDFEAANIE